MLRVCFIGSAGHYPYALNGLRGRTDAKAVAVAPGCDGEDISAVVTRLESIGQTAKVYKTTERCSIKKKQM